MNSEDLLTSATKKTGLDDFGPEDFREGFNILVDAIEREAGIRDECRANLEERFVNILVQRLLFAKDLKDHPEILDERLGSPLIILSLPRTGSTKLHRMLGATGDFQTLPFWSTMKFARIPGAADGGVAQRISEVKAYEHWMYEQSPDMLKGHPMHAEEPEEECFLMEATYRHPAIFGMYDTPSFARWIASADEKPAYDYLVSVIKYLQWQSEGKPRPWLFKDPNHLGKEDFLSGIYDEPKFIVTHRDPVKCVPSVTSTVMATRKIYSDQDNRHAFGSKMLDGLSAAVNRHIAWRERNSHFDILDLSFNEVVDNSEAVLRKVYDFAGMAFSSASWCRVQEWERANPKDKHGKSNYSAADIGSSDDEITRAFSTYRDRFSDFL